MSVADRTSSSAVPAAIAYRFKMKGGYVWHFDVDPPEGDMWECIEPLYNAPRTEHLRPELAGKKVALPQGYKEKIQQSKRLGAIKLDEDWTLRDILRAWVEPVNEPSPDETAEATQWANVKLYEITHALAQSAPPCPGVDAISKPEVQVTPNDIKIRVRGVPHLMLLRSEVVGVQGYIKNIGPAEPIHVIEVTTKTAEIACEYKDRALWEEILNAMATARLFDERLGEK